MRIVLILFCTLYSATSLFGQLSKSSSILSDPQTITFYSKDSVLISADTYFIDQPKATLLLCHQAGFSRGEYLVTAKKLNSLGYSCMAIDQRSGKEVNGVTNRTAINANEKQMNVGYAGAKKDLEAAIDYLYEYNNKQPIIVVGSSYSASLSLWIAGERHSKVKAVVAFSPGEYLKGKNLAQLIKPIKIPVFVTSSKREIGPVTRLLRNVKEKYLIHYKPQQKGIHGSRAIWESTDGYEGYWQAFTNFLSKQI